MGVGKEGRGVSRPPWILKISAKKVVFFNFERQKPNFTTFGHPPEKVWKNALMPTPWKKSFRRPWMLIHSTISGQSLTCNV